MMNITELSMRESELSGDLFQFLPKLKKFDMTRCLGVSEWSFQWLKQVEHLTISHLTQFEGFSKYLPVNQMKHLQLDYSDILDHELQYLVHLRTFSVTNCPELTMNAFSSMKLLEELSIFDCDNIQTTLESVMQLPELKSIFCRCIENEAMELLKRRGIVVNGH
jgi:hypothetical protein